MVAKTKNLNPGLGARGLDLTGLSSDRLRYRVGDADLWRNTCTALVWIGFRFLPKHRLCLLLVLHPDEVVGRHIDVRDWTTRQGEDWPR